MKKASIPSGAVEFFVIVLSELDTLEASLHCGPATR